MDSLLSAFGINLPSPSPTDRHGPKVRPTTSAQGDDNDNGSGNSRKTPSATSTQTPQVTQSTSSPSRTVQSTSSSVQPATTSSIPTSTPSTFSTEHATSSLSASLSSSSAPATAVSAIPAAPSQTAQPSGGLSDGAKAGIGVGVALAIIIVLVAAALKTFYFDRDRNGKPSIWERWRTQNNRAQSPPPLEPWEKSIAAMPSYDPDHRMRQNVLPRKAVPSTAAHTAAPRSVLAQEQRSLSSSSTTQLLGPEKQLPNTPQPTYQAYRPKSRSELFLD